MGNVGKSRRAGSVNRRDPWDVTPIVDRRRMVPPHRRQSRERGPSHPPGNLHHDSPLHPATRFPDQADRSTPGSGWSHEVLRNKSRTDAADARIFSSRTRSAGDRRLPHAGSSRIGWLRRAGRSILHFHAQILYRHRRLSRPAVRSILGPSNTPKPVSKPIKGSRKIPPRTS